MASGNEVILTFAGDHDQLEKSFDAVGSAAKRMDDKVGHASKSLDDSTSRVGSLGERADSAETSLIGVHDVIDGTATIMQGPGEAGLVAYIQGWADLAGGIAPLLLQMASLRLATIKQTVAQWASNAAFLASPITWIVLGIGLLIAAVVLIATKTDWFQRGWKAAWGGIKAAAFAVWNWIKSNWPLLLGILFGPFGLMVGLIIKNWDKVLGFIKGLPGRIGKAASGMWDGIKNAFRGALNWIIDKWNNFSLHLEVPHNKLSDFVGLGGKGFTVNTPDIPRFHSGIDRVPGAPGSEMLAILQAGERVTPRGGGGAVTVQLHLSGSGSLASLFLGAIRAGDIKLSANGVRVMPA